MLEFLTPLLLKITAAACLICAAAYIYLKKQYRYWKDHGVPGPEPEMFIGNMGEVFSLKYTEPEMMDKWYKEYRNEPYIGFYNLWKPSLFVIDPDLIKKITENDFSHFTDHPPISGNSESDGVVDSLFTMKGERWKARRQIFSKLFAPKKLREYINIANNYNSHLMKEIDEELAPSGDIEVEHIFERHVMRAVVAIMYSVDISRDEERTSKLSELSAVFARPSVVTVYKVLLCSIFPSIFLSFGLNTFPTEFWKYFSNFTKELLYSRREANSDPENLVDLVNKLQKEGHFVTKKINQESVGHIFSFFIAGHHTTLTTLSYVLYVLSLNPEVQEKLRKEIENVLNGKDHISYECTNKMTYMDDVINETLRLYPLLGILKRTCTKPYKIDDNFYVPKDMDVMIPVNAIHRDPQYFPDPDKFWPERFSDLKKPPTVFMTFGKGPRTCIGIRLAYILLKVALAKIISEYLVLPSSKMEHPIKLDTKTVIITIRPLNGIWVKMEKRKKA